MQFICIGVNECVDEIVQRLTSELEQLNKLKINYTLDKVNTEGLTSIVCSVNSENTEEDSTQLYRELTICVSNAMADYIVGQYDVRLIGRIVNSNYCYFNSIEKKEILNLAIRCIKNEDKSLFNNLFQVRRRNIIIRKLMSYFEDSNSLILEGFINFRLKDYIKDLEEIVDKAVDDFLTEREYREFIRLLRYFVDVQEPKFEVINVLVGYDGKYILLDEEGREITNECISEFVNEISDGEINYDDLLVSCLITLAPRKVIIHSVHEFMNKELLETIKNVFFGRIILCTECDMCSINMARSKNKK